MKDRKTNPWFPFWIDKWLFGSTRIELQPDERGVFVDLMSLSKKDDGFIRANEGVPYLESQLCGLLNITPELLKRTLEKCLKFKKVKKLDDGTLYMTSHDNYKLSQRHQDRLSGDPLITNEVILQEKICDDLTKLNIPYEKQKITNSGRIDIFISLNPPKIIEVKSDSSADKIRIAIGQLLIYKKDFPSAELYIATPEKMHTKILRKLEYYGIKEWSCPDSRHDGREADAYIYRERIKENKIKEKENTEKNNFDSLFEEFWKVYPKKVAKDYAKEKFMILARQDKIPELIKAMNGYLDFLKHRRIKDNFEQEPMNPATFLMKNRWKDYIDFKYMPPL